MDMKTLQDIREMVRLEVNHFNIRHRNNPFAKCYLWFYPTSSERDGGIAAFGDDVEHPHNVTANKDLPWELVTAEGFRNTGENVRDILTMRNILSRLPVLSLDA
jgi:hypothetical protein